MLAVSRISGFYVPEIRNSEEQKFVIHICKSASDTCMESRNE